MSSASAEDGGYGTFHEREGSRSNDLDHGRSSKQTNDDRRQRVGNLIKAVARFLLRQWFLVVLVLLIVLASQKQVPLDRQAAKKDIVLYLSVSVIFFVTGCTLPTDVLIQNYSRWRLHLFCQGQSFLLNSLCVFGIVSATASNPDFMDAGLLVGLLLMGCVPTTISSNIVLTKEAGGNQALTVAQSTLGNFLGPFLCPVLLLMYLSAGAWYTKSLPLEKVHEFGALYKRVFKQLGLSIYLPLVIGQFVRKYFPRVTKKVFADFQLSKIGSVALLTIMWSAFDGAYATGAFDDIETSNVLFLVIISIALYAIWTLISIALSIPWLNRQDTVAVAYTVPAKTTSIGVPLSEAIFKGLPPMLLAKFQIPIVIFQGLQVAFGSVLTGFFHRWITTGSAPPEIRVEDADE